MFLESYQRLPRCFREFRRVSDMFGDLKRFLVIFRTPKNFRKLQRVLAIFGDIRRFLDSFGTFPMSFRVS